MALVKSGSGNIQGQMTLQQVSAKAKAAAAKAAVMAKSPQVPTLGADDPILAPVAPARAGGRRDKADGERKYR